MSKTSTSDLKSMLASETFDALAAISAARLMEERADAMDYYLGDMAKDMPAQDGRSRAVSTDVAVMPSPTEVFAGSDEVVSRRAKDGHHYMADPKRRGKYLLAAHHA
jgi:hypothetical protein